MTPANLIFLVLAAAGIVVFSLILVHAARTLRTGALPSAFLSRAHAKRRVASSLLIVLALLWLLVGMTLLKERIFSPDHPLLALIFLAGLALAVLAVLVLAWLDFREARRAYQQNFLRSRRDEIRTVVRDAIDEYHRKNPPPPPPSHPPAHSDN